MTNTSATTTYIQHAASSKHSSVCLTCRQVHEWRHLTLCAALPMQASEQLRTTTNAQQLQKGLAWEMHNGYVNTQVHCLNCLDCAHHANGLTSQRCHTCRHVAKHLARHAHSLPVQCNLSYDLLCFHSTCGCRAGKLSVTLLLSSFSSWSTKSHYHFRRTPVKSSQKVSLQCGCRVLPIDCMLFCIRTVCM